jgi:phosphopantothenoylcysteine decarboxylase/phosphopantothenate--cysteine ligase
MFRSVHEEIADTDIFIGCAAVSDYRPGNVAPQKIKRSAPEIELALVRSPDTLASVAGMAEPPFTVGFAAETQDVAAHARDKLERKHLDMIAANRVGPDCGFDRETNALTVFWRDGEVALGEGSKLVLARRLIELIADRYRVARGSALSSSRAG